MGDYKLYQGDCLELMNDIRNFIGIELDEKYFEIAKERIENAMNEAN